MKVLFLAPQPFFQERGTPIAVRLALQVLAKRGGDSIDLLTYHEGRDVQIPNVAIHRIPAPRWIRDIPPGFSFKKLFCDCIMLLSALQLVWKNRAGQYELVHAVEESVFIAWIIKLLFRIPYIYDMDSSIALQLTEKFPFCRLLLPFLRFFEKITFTSFSLII